MLNSPQLPPQRSVQQPHKDSTDPIQVTDMTLEQQVLLVSLEDDPQHESQESVAKEVKEGWQYRHQE
ncbi:hypothetical protein BGX23_003464 [Mortierella sp. AD031]|nr:hypothetical protein BGX23_003464 [Mortierella sp. AD031]